jgi:hypothetical protein
LSSRPRFARPARNARWRAGSLALVFVVAMLTGCWSLTTDVERIVGGAPVDATAADAGGESSANPPRDAAPDEVRPDAGFCVLTGGAHTLCDDFDTGALGARWTEPHQIAGGRVMLAGAPTPAKSVPNVLRATLPSGCTNASAQLSKRFDAAAGQSVVSFELFVVAAPPSEVINLVGLMYPTSGGEYRADVGLRAGRIEVADNDIGGRGFMVRGTGGANLVPGGFRRVEATFVLAPEPPRVVVKVDGVSDVDAAIVPTAGSAATTTLDFGLFAPTGCATEIEARFDDVLVDFVAR